MQALGDPSRMDMQWQLPPDVGRRLAPIALLLLGGGGLYWWLSAPSATGPATATKAPVAVAESTSDFVLVDVTGTVHRPGVVRLAAGARVIDAVEAAGGVLSGHAAGVNLARVLVDGEQIVVGAASAGSGTTGTGSARGGKLNVNAATASELDALPGIGTVLAERIIDYRTKHGPFATLRDLLDVPGIGDAKYANLADAVTIA